MQDMQCLVSKPASIVSRMESNFPIPPTVTQFRQLRDGYWLHGRG